MKLDKIEHSNECQKKQRKQEIRYKWKNFRRLVNLTYTTKNKITTNNKSLYKLYTQTYIYQHWLKRSV